MSASDPKQTLDEVVIEGDYSPMASKNEKIAAIDKILKLLNSSEDSFHSSKTVSELKEELNSAKKALEMGDVESIEKMSCLFAPTGALEETSYDNGWGDEFLDIAVYFD